MGPRRTGALAEGGAESARPPKLPPTWFKHAFWRVHRVLNKVSGGRVLWTPWSKRARLADRRSRAVHARRAVGEERERLWQRWAEIVLQLDGYAGLRTTDTPVVILEPRDGTA